MITYLEKDCTKILGDENMLDRDSKWLKFSNDLVLLERKIDILIIFKVS